MSELARFQQAFADVVRGRAPFDTLAGHITDADEAWKLAVYRNNFVAAAVEALEKSFPSVVRLVGDAFFRAMARAYVDDHPPRSRQLVRYGARFADHIAAFPPAAELAYLPDVARLDRAYLDALFAPDEPALEPERLARVAPEDIGALTPGLHVSARVLASAYPAYSIWRANSGDVDASSVDGASVDVSAIDVTGGGETALIWRSGPDGRHRTLSSGEAAFFIAIRNGAAIAQAIEAAVAADDAIDIAATLAGAFATGVFADIEHTDIEYEETT